MRSAIGDILENAPTAPERPPVQVRQRARLAPELPRRRRIAALSAAALVVAGLVGLVMFSGRSTPSSPADEPTVTSSPSDSRPDRRASITGQLAPSDWVVATALPDGFEFLYARRDSLGPDPDQHSRTVAYGVPRGDGTEEGLSIEIGGPHQQTSAESLAGSDDIWTIDRSASGWWSASVRVGDTDLNVRGSGDVDEEVLVRLTVVDEAVLPFTPLGDPDDAAVVARTSFDSRVYTYSVQESGHYRCHWVTSETGASSGCGPRVEPDADVTIDAGETFETIDRGARPDMVDAVRAGSVSAAAASVEVVFADGTTVTVEPTDLSQTFDKLFWIAAATIGTDSQTGLPVTEETVAVVRAYDSVGNLLGTAIPPSLTNPGEEPATEE